MPWYFYLALKQLFPTGRFFSFFASISIIGVALGVAVLVVVQSVMNGFGHEIRKKLAETYGHVRLQSGQIIFQADHLIALAEDLPEVAAVNRYAEGMVLLQHLNRPAFPVVRGIDVNAPTQVIPLDQFVKPGTLDDLDDQTILVGSTLARSLGIVPGSTVEVYSPLMLDRMKQEEILLPRELEVVGLFETGYGQIDSNTVLVTLRLMQELYGLEAGIHGLMLKLHRPDQAETLALRLNQTLDPPMRALTWLDENEDLLFVLQLEKQVMFFIILFIILVASFSIASTLLTSVVRKTREIGLLGAMGARPPQIAMIFSLQGLIIGIIGTSLGFTLAAIALHFRNEFVQAVAHLTETEAVIARFYQFVDLPALYDTRDLLAISLAAIGISTLAGLLPAYRAARLKPSEALRNE